MIPKAALWSIGTLITFGDWTKNAIPQEKRPEIVLNLLLTLMWNRSDIAHKHKITTCHQCSVTPKIHSNLCCPKAQTYATDTPDRANMDPSSNIPWPPLRSDLITAWSGDFDRRVPPPPPQHQGTGFTALGCWQTALVHTSESLSCVTLALCSVGPLKSFLSHERTHMFASPTDRKWNQSRRLVNRAPTPLPEGRSRPRSGSRSQKKP